MIMPKNSAWDAVRGLSPQAMYSYIVKFANKLDGSDMVILAAACKELEEHIQLKNKNNPVFEVFGG